jgi:hypothetical protein
MPNMTGERHPFYGKKHSEESKLKISETKKKNKIPPWNKGLLGVKRSPLKEETKQKISKAHLGKVLSQETKEKISLNRKGKNSGKNSKSSKIYENIQLVSPDGEIFLRIECLTDFAKEHGVPMKGLWKVIHKKLNPIKDGSYLHKLFSL